MNEVPITIKLFKKQIVNDVSVDCNVIGRTLQKSDDTAEQGAEIMSPDDEATKPIVARSISEGFAEVRRVCKRYLLTGRDTDDNRLEQIDERDVDKETVQAGTTDTTCTKTLQVGKPCSIVIKTSGTVTVTTSTGKSLGTASGVAAFDYTATATDEKIVLKSSGDAAVEAIVSYKYGEFGTLILELAMPSSFNKGVTETIKANCHRIIVDYTVRSLLFNQYPDKAASYNERLTEDEEKLRSSLISRVGINRRASDWS
jgi:hypothetical protein